VREPWLRPLLESHRWRLNTTYMWDPRVGDRRVDEEGEDKGHERHFTPFANSDPSCSAALACHVIKSGKNASISQH
jgi:hypothetical protein